MKSDRIRKKGGESGKDMISSRQSRTALCSMEKIKVKYRNSKFLGICMNKESTGNSVIDDESVCET